MDDLSSSSNVPNIPDFGPCSVTVTGTDPVPSCAELDPATPNAEALLGLEVPFQLY